MSSIARTQATGGGGMLPELLAWSSSLAVDRAMAREDLLGSAAHATMLGKTGLIPIGDARVLRETLLAMFDEAERGELRVADDEEDIHMAVEAELARRLGAVSGRLHTARSRNDQVALDLRLHVRAQAAATVHEATGLVTELCDRAATETRTLIPAYTHRQRAQPISAAFMMVAWGAQILRAADVVGFALARCDALPLGSGACSGTSLQIDRALTSRLLGFSGPTLNALDTVGDRDFALDWVWGGARVLLALSRMSTDLIDFASQEFGLVRLDGRISAGSSMMPQKKNPDVFELVRGESSRGVGNVMALLTLVKGLPTGYNRDLQEDRRPLLETGRLVRSAVSAVRLALPHVTFDPSRGASALSDGYTQATDLAEGLVRKGVPFREAYLAIGALVRKAVDAKVPLSMLDPHEAAAVHPGIDATVLGALDAYAAMAAKESVGGTGPGAVAAQIEALRGGATRLATKAAEAPTLDALAAGIRAEPLG